MRSDAWRKYCDTRAASYFESLIRWTNDDFWTLNQIKFFTNWGIQYKNKLTVHDSY